MGYGADGVAARGYVSGVGIREDDGCVRFGATGQDAPRRAFEVRVPQDARDWRARHDCSMLHL